MMTIDDIKPGQGQEIEEKEGKITPRTQARRVALQALYQWQMTKEEISQIVKQFQEDSLLEGLDFELFEDLLSNVSATAEELDAIYAEYLDRSVYMIDPVERAIMRMGVYELQSKMRSI